MEKKDYVELLEVFVENTVVPRLEARIATLMKDAVARYSVEVDRQIDDRIRAMISRGTIRVAFGDY